MLLRLRLVLPLVLIGCTDGSGPADGGGGEALRLEKEGRWAEAAALHRREALRLGPRRGDQSVKQALVAYLMADRLGEAERFAEELLERDPSRAEVLFYLGDSQRVLMQYQGARATLRRLLDLEPDHGKGTLALAHVLLRLGEPGEALPLFEKFLRQSEATGPLRDQAEMDRARALRRLGRLREAADGLAALLERDPHHPVALSEAAQTFFQRKREELAKGLREKYAWLSARGHQLSSEDETKLYSQEVSPEGSLARKALQAADRREFLAAIESLERLCAAWPGDPANAFALARLWMRLQRFEDALRALETALEGKRGGLPGLQALRAEALRALGRLEEAREAYRGASSLFAREKAGREETLGTSALETHLTLGRLELEPGGDPERAAECFQRALALAPQDPRPLLGQARLALQRGQIAEVRPLLEAARERAGEDPPELRRLGAQLKGLEGDLRSAAREIMDLIRRNPTDLESFQAFERVFGSRALEREVGRVLEMKRALEERLLARESFLLSLSAKPFRDCANEYLALGKLLLESGNREEALDSFLLAAELDPVGVEGLRQAAASLTAQGEAFVRLHLFRRILARFPDDREAIGSLAHLYLELDLRLEEAEALASRLAVLEPGEGSERLLSTIRERLRTERG